MTGAGTSEAEASEAEASEAEASAYAPSAEDGVAAAPVPPGDAGAARGGIGALSMPYQVVAAVALAVVGVLACVHLAMVFLHVAPSNTLTKQHGEAVDDWVYPEFEQNWKLFAPNPLQQNIAVQVRAELSRPDGTRTTTGWTDLTGQDIAQIRGNPMPSHTEQNELRRAWDFFLNTHTDDQRPNGMRGRLSEQYMRRIVMLRLDERALGGTVRKIQLRSATRPVPAPAWSAEKINTEPSFRTYPWWRVTAADRPGATAASSTEAQAGTEAAR
ncbi:DUF5819 family protein [Streptomyces roseicoloratus]|uniref:DUF5819 family protein n=2 Tax=Streptomyces roseicoloratus TaxID=2508722 RepID=A0ABY9RWI4_9ACTN|nr:DUF5819 family protein [Streptomyces roseicoloratus]WMX46129.1 DUF5819 family protein [Streptomyces roseicoloratus]